MALIKYRKIWYALSIILIGFSIWAVSARGFKLSIDFVGGTLTEVSYKDDRPVQSSLEYLINDTLDIGIFSLRASGDKNYVIRTRGLDQEEKQKLNNILGGTVERQTTIGPTAGRELQSKAVKAILVVIVMIVLFITFAFRKVSPPAGPGGQASPPSSWKYGFATIIALAHDVIIPMGVFVILGHEIDLLFVTGLLAILGYSVHDTIVVFDRVRENLQTNHDQNRQEEFEMVVGKSVNQTFGRSINTSLTIFLMLLALYLFGSPVTQNFSLLLIIGLIAGTYSSIFIASPLLVTFYNLQRKVE